MNSNPVELGAAGRVRPIPAPNDLPVVIAGPGDYVSRDGRRITIHDVKSPPELGSTLFAASGSVWSEFRGAVRPRGYTTWHVSGRRLPLKDTASDIVGRWIEPEVEADAAPTPGMEQMAGVN